MEDSKQVCELNMKRHMWKDDSACFDYDTNLFFDKYEEDESLRKGIDQLCMSCPVKRTCFANGISGKEWGVWGGVFLEGGEISREFNKHKTKQDWGNTWSALTMEK
jgi:hypothetical protein